MQIDRSHRRWLIATLILMGVATAGYIPYSVLSVHGPSGGSWTGLAYGLAAFGVMLFAGLLGVRSRFPVWRIGRARSWMKGHLWLGVLVAPLILFHSGFQFGGTLTTVLTLLTLLVVASGIFGALLQHYLPRIITAQVPHETIYEQMDAARRHLSEEAAAIVAATQAAAEPDLPEAAVDASLPKTFRLAAMLDAQAKLDQKETVLLVRSDPKAVDRFHSFYRLEVERFLAAPDDGEHALGTAAQANLRFKQLRTMLPQRLHEAADDLESICEEARQLNRQAKLHRWLHGWLLLHIPLSYVVLLLAAIHAVMALRY